MDEVKLAQQTEIKDDEELFKEQVKQYFADSKELGFWQRREVKKWIKEILGLKKYLGKFVKNKQRIIEKFGREDTKTMEGLKLMMVEVVMEGQKVADFGLSKKEVMEKSVDELEQMIISQTEEIQRYSEGRFE